MPAFVIVHFHNARPGCEAELDHWFEARHAPEILGVPGVGAVQRLVLSDTQMMKDCPQPWRFMSLYDIESDTPAAVLAEFDRSARQMAAGLMAEQASHTFEWTRPWVLSSQPPLSSAQSYLMMVMGNCTPGMEAEYHQWYDVVHAPDVLGSPGMAALRRGTLAARQAQPDNQHHADRLVMVEIRTADFEATAAEFKARYDGTTKSGVVWGARTAAASLNRTVHVFLPVTERLVPRLPR